MTIVSLMAYLFIPCSEGVKFYHLLFRLYELIIGGIAGLYYGKSEKTKRGKIFPLLLLSVLLILVQSLFVCDFSDIGRIHAIGQEYNIRYTILPKNISVVLISFATVLLCLLGNGRVIKGCNFIAEIGKRSYSIFIWHQIIIAFCRYCITYKINLGIFLGIVCVLVLFTEVSYVLIEKRKKKNKLFYFSGIMVTFLSISIYLQNGIIHSYDRINLSLEDASDYVNYNAQGYNYDKNFTDSNKIKCLCVGNSFARDWINVLLSSEMRDYIEVSYISNEFSEQQRQRVEEADYIFYFGHKKNIPDWVYEQKKDDTQIWGIGTKSFGECFGINYLNRLTSVKLDEEYEKLNQELRREYGDNYIDIIGCVRNDDGDIRLYDNSGKYISVDTEHLTRSGAAYVADKVDFEIIFGKDFNIT